MLLLNVVSLFLTGQEMNLTRAFICGLSLIRGELVLENHIRFGDEFEWNVTQV